MNKQEWLSLELEKLSVSHGKDKSSYATIFNIIDMCGVEYVEFLNNEIKQLEELIKIAEIYKEMKDDEYMEYPRV